MTDPDDTIHIGFLDEEPRVGGTVTIAPERGADRTPVRTATSADGRSERLTARSTDRIVAGNDTPDRSGIEWPTAGRKDHSAPLFVPFPEEDREGIVP